MGWSIRGIAAILLFTHLWGCASTGRSTSGRFYHRQEAENVFIIGFNGNAPNNSQRTTDFLMLLAAEVGRRLGYTCFVLDGNTGGSQSRTAGARVVSTKPGHVGEPGKSAAYQPREMRSSMRPITDKPGREIMVTYSKRVPKGRSRSVYVINDLLGYLRSKYNINS